MSSTYIDPFVYRRMPTGLSLAPYIGNQFRFAAPVTQGSTTLTVPATAITVDLHAYDNLYLFDGLNSEIVEVASTTTVGMTSIPLVAATQFAHAAGIAVCGDGAKGSLGEQLFTAGQWVEDLCHQSLWVSTYAGEILSMPTMRASIDEQGLLWFRPRHFPITALTALSIQAGNFTATPYDPTQAVIDGDRQIVQVPQLVPLSSGNQPPYTIFPSPIGRATKATLTITYNSGWTALPTTVQRACSLLTNQCFVELYNNVGADQIQMGKRNVSFTLRGDPSGESLLVKQARKLLQPYIVEES